MNIDVNYRNKRRYKTARYPMHQTKFWTWLILFLSKIALIGKTYKVEKINMEGVRAPYMLLSNHMHFIDFELTATATWPGPSAEFCSGVTFWLCIRKHAILPAVPPPLCQTLWAS